MNLLEKIFIACFSFLFFLSISFFIYFGIQEQKEWEVFSKKNNCKITNIQPPTTEIAMAVNIIEGGITPVILNNSGKEAWICDDGVTYWR